MTIDRRPVLDPLSRLAIRHGSDKFGGHLYTPLYHELLEGWRERPLRFLEIGIGGYDSEEAGGSSLRMWADYFPCATIVGLDYYRKRFDHADRIKIEQGSQDDPAVLDRLQDRYGPFDVIVDDGSHAPLHILASFRHLYPLMAPDGLYIVEDTNIAFRPGSGGDNEGSNSIFALAHAVSLAMHVNEGHAAPNEDVARLGRITTSITVARNVFAFRRGVNEYPSNLGFDLDQAGVRAVTEAIAREAEDNPAPRNALSRIDMAIWGGNRDLAASLAVASAERWPCDRGLLIELERMMRWAGQGAAFDRIAAMRARLEAAGL